MLHADAIIIMHNILFATLISSFLVNNYIPFSFKQEFGLFCGKKNIIFLKVGEIWRAQSAIYAILYSSD
jgi:hypothetical protein